jgi:hypothetical protein
MGTGTAEMQGKVPGDGLNELDQTRAEERDSTDFKRKRVS